MKQIRKVLAIVLVVLMLVSILPVSAFALSNATIAADGSYFHWGPEDGSRGFLMLDDDFELKLYYYNGRFYCDPDHLYEFIGLARMDPNQPTSPTHPTNLAGALEGSTYPGAAAFELAGRPIAAMHSPSTISELSVKIAAAFHELAYGAHSQLDKWTVPDTTFGRTGAYYYAQQSNYNLTIILDSPYTVTDSEFNYANFESKNARKVYWGPTYSFNTYSETTAVWPTGMNYWGVGDAFARFSGTLNVVRGAAKGVLINVPASAHAPTGAYGNAPNLSVQFAPGDRTTIDNRTTDDDDVAIRIDTLNLLHFENCKLTNSLSVGEKGSDNCAYYGTGIVVTGIYDNVELNGSVELGTDIGGSCVIEKCSVGIDMEKGVTRFKAAGEIPYTLADNINAITMRRGTYLAKWTDDISMIDPFNVMITVDDPTAWKKGDQIFCSGQSLYGGALHVTPLLESDLNTIEFQYAGDMFRVFGLKYVTDTTGCTFDNPSTPNVIEGNAYTFPKFVLAGDKDDGQIYNPRLGYWYTSLTNAVYDVDELGNRLLRDGDELIYFDNVNEQRDVVIDRSITVRAAKVGTIDETKYAEDCIPPKTVSATGYTATWFNSHDNESFIRVAPGKIVTFGGDNSGPFTINCGGYGRFAAVDNTATLNLKSNLNVLNAVCLQDAELSGSAIYQNGTLNVEGNFNLNGSSVYLPVGKVITKAGDFTNNIVVELANVNPQGRDILVSSLTSDVVSGDNDKIVLNQTLPEGTVKKYSIAGADSVYYVGASEAVVELNIKVYVVEYDDGAGGEFFSAVLDEDDIVRFENLQHGVATPMLSADIIGAVTGKIHQRFGYDFAGWEPVIAPVVTCDVIYVAQWTPYILIHHSSAPEAAPEKVTLAFDEDGEITSFNITTHVYTNYLYGGVATDEDYDTPDDNLYGLEIYPEYGGQEFYLREVSVKFLCPTVISVKPHGSTPHNEITHYLLTAIDADGLNNEFYVGYGFALDRTELSDSVLDGNAVLGDGSDLNVSQYALYSTIGVYKYKQAGVPESAELSASYTPRQIFTQINEGEGAYFGCVPLEEHYNFDFLMEYYMEVDDNGEKSFTFTPYYVTVDGVVVTGVYDEEVDTNSSATAPETKYNKTGSAVAPAGEITPLGITVYANASPANLMICNTFAALPKPVAPKINVSVIANGMLNQVSVAAGNIAGKVNAPAVSGMIFAGWYTDAGFRTAADLTNVQSDMTVYAKYISDRYFAVAAATTVCKGELCKIRFISAIDDVNYAEFGMKITVNGETTVCPSTRTYASVSGSKAQKIFGTSVSKNAKLFYEDLLTSGFADGTEVSVTPYFVTSDGTTIEGMTAELICHAGSIETR